MANKNNPKNHTIGQLFKSLTRLFSGPIINYRSQSGRRIRRQHLWTSSLAVDLNQPLVSSLRKSLYNPLDQISTNAIQNQQRAERYIDFDQMEYMPEIASVS